jgi:putative FmdB family regulatory protein
MTDATRRRHLDRLMGAGVSEMGRRAPHGTAHPRNNPQRGGMVMPLYQYLCPRCHKEVSLTLTVKERESGSAKCPECRTALEPLMATFYSKTSRKS